MKKRVVFAFFLGALVLSLCSTSATEYEREYTQVGDKLVIKESINNIKISNYVSSNTLEKSSLGYYLTEKIVFNESYSNVKIIFKFEEGVILEDSEAYPAGYETESDGRTISLVWKLNEVQKNQVFAIFVKLKDTKNTRSSLWFLTLLLILIIYVIYRQIKNKKIIAKIKYPKKIKGKSKTLKEEYDFLLDTEKRVIEELKKADRNELWQKQIQNSSGFSKAKVSRLIRNLEARSLIVKIPFGNTNKIRLK